MRFWVLILALLCGPLLAQSDPDLGAMNDAALNAFQQGDLTQARVLAERALTAAQNLDNPDPDAFVFAHNNVAYLLSTTGSDMARAARIWDQALAFLRARQRFGTAAGLTVLTEYSAHNLRVGNPTRAGELMSQASQAARATPFQGNVAQLALGFYLETAQYQNVVVALREVVLSNSALLNGSSNDLYSQFASHISTAEETGDWDTVFSLLEAKKILIQTYYPENLRQTATRELEFQRFNARHRAGQSDLARQEMRLWLSSDTTTEDDRAFIDDMTRNAEKFADNIAINSLENLAVAQIAAQSVGAKPNEDNPRLGLALSNIALAESKFGRHDLAQATMQRAIPILERSETGRTHLSSVYAQLAWITNLAGDPDRAIALYDLSDAAAEASPGVDPTAVVDAVWLLADQTVFLTENGFLDAATARLARAQAQIATQAAQSSDPWMLALTSSRLKRVGFWLDLEKGQATQAIAPWLAVVDDLRKAAPENSVDFSAALIDIAQIVGFSGDMQSAQTLAREAVALNDAVLPDEANDSKVARTFLAQVLMQTGDRADAQRQYRRLTQAHKSPAYRENLPEVSWDFELFAWLLIDTPTPPPPAHVDEAFQALQWTQVTRSAEALQFLETRLSVDDPGRGGLLRERQDIQEQHSALSARLAASVANTARDPAVIERLSGELAKIDRDMSGIDGSLAAMGVGNLGLGAITPMSVADVQATLADDEMVVTFVLASLQPAAIPGLESSANHIVAITADRVHIARMGEPSRRTLRARIQAFRCDVAISDPGCSGGGAQGLRGAMQAGGPKAADPRAHFDFDAAHSLYRDLFGGLDGIVENYPNLIIAPPSDMLRLPFAALVTTPGTPKRLRRANWMIRSHAISVLPSITSLRALRDGPRAPRKLQRMVGFGDPVIGAPASVACDTLDLAALRAAPPMTSHIAGADRATGVALADVGYLSALPRLPDAVCELQAIAKGFGPQNAALHLGADATEAQLKSMDQNGTLEGFDVVVFATHGLTAGEAGGIAPGLVLTPPAQASLEDDGLLTAGEIASLNLNADLVVLSACNTAAGDRGDEDGLSGLARAFFQSGARSLLVTHWSVYSEAAVDMTTGLFQALNDDGDLSYASALQAATHAVLDDPTRPAFQYHPSYWGAFSIVGAS